MKSVSKEVFVCYCNDVNGYIQGDDEPVCGKCLVRELAEDLIRVLTWGEN